MTTSRRLLIRGTWLHKENIMVILREYEEHKERHEAAVERFKLGEIQETDFRLLLAALGYNASDIDAEVTQARSDLEDGV